MYDFVYTYIPNKMCFWGLSGNGVWPRIYLIHGWNGVHYVLTNPCPFTRQNRLSGKSSHLPSGKQPHNYWKSPLLVGNKKKSCMSQGTKAEMQDTSQTDADACPETPYGLISVATSLSVVLKRRDVATIWISKKAPKISKIQKGAGEDLAM